MTPEAIAALAIQLVSAALSIIGQIKGQGGMTTEQILAASDSTDQNTQDLITQYLAALPPTPGS